MFLAVSIDNSRITLAVYNDGALLSCSYISTDIGKTADEYVLTLRGILSIDGIAPADILSCLISSVVAPLSPVFTDAIFKLTGRVPTFVGPGIKTGLSIKIDNPAQLGSDIVAASVGALCLAPPPIIIIDLGLATTMSVIDDDGAFIGTIIIPGITSALKALERAAGSLPAISLDAPKTLIGKNTVDSMRSGALYGTCSMLDGMISKIRATLSAVPTVFATGEHAPLILPHCEHDMTLAPNLLTDGLAHLSQINMHCTRNSGQ
ncbi:MAG: type III pantothenate kinase [Clostridia bacterium]